MTDTHRAFRIGYPDEDAWFAKRVGDAIEDVHREMSNRDIRRGKVGSFLEDFGRRLVPRLYADRLPSIVENGILVIAAARVTGGHLELVTASAAPGPETIQEAMNTLYSTSPERTTLAFVTFSTTIRPNALGAAERIVLLAVTPVIEGEYSRRSWTTGIVRPNTPITFGEWSSTAPPQSVVQSSEGSLN